MLSYYKDNIQLYILFIIWVLVGMFASTLSYVLIPLTLWLLFKRKRYEELIIGYLFILILSDSLTPSLAFAKSVKNIYISILAVFFFLDMKNFQPINRLYKIFLPFFIFAAFTMLLSVGEKYFSISLQKTISFALSLLVLPNYFVKLYKDDGEQVFKRFIFFVVTVLLLGLVSKYLAHDFAYLENGRFRGALGSPNGLGIYCVLSFISFFIINNFFPDLFNKQERIIILSVIILSIYLSGSRNSVIAVLIFYLFQRFFSLSPFLGFIIFAFALVLTEIINNNLTSIILSLGLGRFFRVNTLEEGSGRYIAWNFAWNHIQQNFLIGKGFAYNEYFMRQNYGYLSKLGHQGGIHNSFLTFWMDQGLIGLILYLRSYLLLFIKAAKNTKYAFPIMFAVSFTAMFESWLVGSLSAFAFLITFIFTVITTEEVTNVSSNVNNQVIE